MSIIFSLILWVQVLYSLWQFFRVTKFLRLPYVFMGMMWNKGYGESCLKLRQVLKLTQSVDEGYCKIQQVPIGYTLSPERRKEIGFVYKLHELDPEGGRLYNGHDVFECSFNLGGVPYKYILKPDVCHMLQLYLEETLDAYTQETVLYKGVFLLKCEGYKNVIDFIVNGGNMVKKDLNCILDYTSEDYLNQNFMRILSIAPLVFQAKGLSSASTIISAFIIATDYLSYPLNKFWELLKSVFFKYFKYLLSFLPKKPRVWIHHLLSTGTDSFMYCNEIRMKSYFKKCKTFPIVLNTESMSMKIVNKPPNNYFDGFEYLNKVGTGYPFVIEGETVCLIVKDPDDRLELDNRRPKYCIEISSDSLGVIKINVIQWELVRFLNFLKMCEDVGIPAKFIRGNSCHLYSLKELLVTMNFNDVVVVEFENEVELFVSDIRVSHNLFKLIKRSGVSDQCVCKCFNYIRGFINKGIEGSKFSKDADVGVLKEESYILSVLTGLLCGSNGCSRPFGWMNSQWKRLCNDVKGILISDNHKGNLTITKKVSKFAMSFIMVSANQAILDSGLKVFKFLDSPGDSIEAKVNEQNMKESSTYNSIKASRRRALRAQSARVKEARNCKKKKKIDSGIAKLKETIDKLKSLPKSKRIDDRIAQLESELKKIAPETSGFISSEKMPKYNSYKDALSSNLSWLNLKSDQKIESEAVYLPSKIIKERKKCIYDPNETIKNDLIPMSVKRIEEFKADRDNFVIKLTSNRFKCLEDIEEFESKGEEYLGKKEAKRKRKSIMFVKSNKAPSSWYDHLRKLKSSIYHMQEVVNTSKKELGSKMVFEKYVSSLSNVYETFKTLKGVAQSKRVVDSCYGVLSKARAEVGKEENMSEESVPCRIGALSNLVKEESKKLTEMNQVIEKKRCEIIRNTEIGWVCGYEPKTPAVKLKIKTVFKKAQVIDLLRDIVKSSIDPSVISVGQLNRFKIIGVKTKSEEDLMYDDDCVREILGNISVLENFLKDARKILDLCGDGKYL